MKSHSDDNIDYIIKYNDTVSMYDVFGNDTSIFYTLASAWGRICYSNEIDTAAVSFCRSSGRPLEFIFNEKFFKKLTTEQKKFVISHECLHVILEHGIRGRGLNEELTNIAMDIVINEMLIRHYGYEKEDIIGLKPCLIENIFDDDELILPDMSFEYYLNKLEERPRKYNKLDDHSYIFETGEIIKGKMDKLLDGLNPYRLDKLAKLAGDGELQEKVKVKIKRMVSKKLAKLITNFKRKAINENRSEQWVFKDRRLTNLDMLIPQDGDNVSNCKSKVNVAFFADCSGSCTVYAESFYNTLFSIPTTHVNCSYYLFDTVCMKIKRGDHMIYGGGTYFHIIEKELLSRKIYPDLVFVITDGDGNTVTPKYPNRWHVFLTRPDNGKMFRNVKNIYNYSTLDSSFSKKNDPTPF